MFVLKVKLSTFSVETTLTQANIVVIFFKMCFGATSGPLLSGRLIKANFVEAVN